MPLNHLKTFCLCCCRCAKEKEECSEAPNCCGGGTSLYCQLNDALDLTGTCEKVRSARSALHPCAAGSVHMLVPMCACAPAGFHALPLGLSSRPGGVWLCTCRCGKARQTHQPPTPITLPCRSAWAMGSTAATLRGTPAAAASRSASAARESAASSARRGALGWLECLG